MRRTMWLGIAGALVVTVCTVALASGLIARSAPGDVIPRIVSVDPPPGAELSLTNPITIAFNTAMDQASTQAALTIQTADGKQTISGAITWPDSATLKFTPSKPLARNSDYVVTFKKGVQSSAGLPLQGTDLIRARTVGDLKVAQLVPADGTKDAAANSVITVIFNRPVVPLLPVEQQGSLPVPIQISPAAQGQGQWLNTSIYQFKPNPPLRGGTAYTVTVKAGLTDQSGGTLPANVTVKFTTQAPQVTTLAVTNPGSYIDLAPAQNNGNTAKPLPAPRDPAIRVEFSQPMDHTATESAFALTGPGGAKTAGKFDWQADSQAFVFTPSALLDYGGLYDVTLDGNAARSDTGATLTASVKGSFTVVSKPDLAQTDPANGTTTTTTNVDLTFTAPMKFDKFMDHVTVTPKPPSLDGQGDDFNPTHFTLILAVEDHTTYTISIDPNGLTDVYGTPLLVNRNNPAYTVTADGKLQIKIIIQLKFDPEASLQTAGPIGLYSAYDPQTRVYSTHRNVSELDLSLWSIDPNALTQILTDNIYSAADNYAPTGPRLRNWKVPVQNPPQTLRYDLLPISASGPSVPQGSGFTCPNAPATRLVVGQTVIVLSDDPRPINVRAQANTTANVIAQLPPGTQFKIVAGPVCANNYVWWQINSPAQTINGTKTPAIVGWVAEGDTQHYFIGPPPGQAAPTAQPAAPSSGSAAAPLKPGAYFLTMSTPNVSNGAPQKHIMIVATANVTLKMGETSATAWLTDLQTGLPISNAPVSFVLSISNSNGSNAPPTVKTFGPATTDTNGLATVTYPAAGALYQATLVALVNDGTHFAAGSTNFSQGIEPYNFNLNTDYAPQQATVYLYSDRSLYKPGQPVYFRGVVRAKNDVTYTLLNRKTIPVEVFDDKNQSIYKADVPLTDFGTFSGQLTLDTHASLGYYTLVATLEPPIPKVYGSGLQFSRQFSVAEYRTPEFQVNVTADQPQVVQGDKVRVTVDSSFFFGGAVNNVNVAWTALSDDFFFNYSGTGNFNFADFNEDGGPNAQSASQFGNEIAHGTGTTDAQGKFVIELPADLGKSTQSKVYTIEAQVTDESGQVVTGRTQVTVHAGTLYIGTAPEQYVTQEKQPAKIDLLTVDWNSQPVPRTNVQVHTVERHWHSVQQVSPDTGQTIWTYDVQEIPVDDATVQTDADGKATYSFTPSHAGEYKVYVTTTDPRGNKVTSSAFVYVAGPEYVPWRQTNSYTFTLKPDSTNYHIGDTASLLIASPFQGPATAWITVERGGILKNDVIQLTDNSTVYKLPIDAGYAPNAFVSVIITKGVDANNPVPAFRIGMAELNINSDEYKLNISVKPDKPQAGPRETVNYAIHVSDAQGKPVKAEVGVGLTDLAVLSLLPDTSTPIMQHFYDQQALSVLTSSTLTVSVDEQTQIILNQVKGGGGGGPEGGIFQVRQLFLDTPLWKPGVVTDANGDATVSVTLPDQLTTWRLDARAVTLPGDPSQTTLVGQQTVDLISTKPLLIRPITPRFFIRGDQSVLAAVVNNNTGADQQVTVKIAVDGATLGSADTQTVSIPSGGRQRVEWPVTVQDVDNVGVTFYANTADNKFTDAAKSAVGQGDNKTLPVYTYEAPETVGTSGQIGTDGGSLTEGVALPTQLNITQGSLDVRFDPSLAAAAIDALKALPNYAYECTEGTISAFLPNVVTYQALSALKVANPDLKATLDSNIQVALQRLYSQQHVDGGWGVCVEDNSDSNTTAYALIGLITAKQNGYTIDQNTLDSAIKYLQGQLTTTSSLTETWQLNRQAFALYALARAGAGNVSRTVDLFNARTKLSVYARAELAMTFHVLNANDSAHLNPLIADLQSSAITSASGQHWQESYQDYWNWNTDTRSTALALQALVEIQPNNTLIPNVVRWLMVARQGSAWETSQETAWSVIALSEWMQHTGELQPAYSFNAALNGQQLIADTSETAASVETPITASVPVAQLQTGTVNKLAITRTIGNGQLYYTAHLTAYLSADQVKALSRGITVTRKYSLASDTTNAPITQAHVGDDVRVTLTIVAPSDLYYVTLIDPIPAGLEAIDPGLATSGSVGTIPELRPQDPFSSGWGWWWFGDTQFLDQQTVLTAAYLPAGTYEYTYVLRTGLAGTYHVIPATMQEQYFPEVYGRSDGALFTLLAATNAAADPTQPTAIPTATTIATAAPAG